MSLKNYLERELVTCNPITNLVEVARMMDDKDVGAVLVVDDDKPCGIVTDRDIVIRCLVDGKDPSQTKVSEVMTQDLETVTLDDGIFDVVQCMKEGKIRRVPVVDNDGKAVGLISMGDVFKLIGEEIHDLTLASTPEENKIQQQGIERAA